MKGYIIALVHQIMYNALTVVDTKKNITPKLRESSPSNEDGNERCHICGNYCQGWYI